MFGARKRRKAKAERDQSSLGNILVALGYCSRNVVHDMLAKQAKTTPLLGELLVGDNVITNDQLEHALLRQRVLRGEEDPLALKRFGSERRREAIGEVASRIRHVADSANLLAQKAKG